MVAFSKNVSCVIMADPARVRCQDEKPVDEVLIVRVPDALKKLFHIQVQNRGRLLLLILHGSQVNGFVINQGKT